MDTDIKARLEKFIENKGVSVSKFEAVCGLGNGYVRKVKSSIGSEKLADILRIYPDLDLYWLLTGTPYQGQNFNQKVTGDGNTQVAGNGNQIGVTGEAFAALRAQLEVKDGQIDRLLSLLENKR